MSDVEKAEDQTDEDPKAGGIPSEPESAAKAAPPKPKVQRAIRPGSVDERIAKVEGMVRFLAGQAGYGATMTELYPPEE